ncbi:DUF2335 domain-containing protein [Enterobacter cloacae]|uniref:DUF2335 domain-containing protein n=1 Tax=Enterobacter cloacae TaxID=550 RepID=UPI0018A1D564|nr:DUF2335 domain-containing protein [Enterobacter cloacae]
MEAQHQADAHSINTQNSTKEPSDDLQAAEACTTEAEVEEFTHEVLSKPHVFLESMNRPEIQHLMIAHEAFSGPFPHPRHLKHYEEILPGSADRIFSLTEREMAHRQRMEEKVLDASVNRDRRGQVCGVISTLAAIFAATYLAINDHDGAAITIIGVIVAVACIFVLRKYPIGRAKRTEREQDQPDSEQIEDKKK